MKQKYPFLKLNPLKRIQDKNINYDTIRSVSTVPISERF